MKPSPKPALSDSSGEPAGYANACVVVRKATSGTPRSIGSRKLRRVSCSSRSKRMYATTSSARPIARASVRFVLASTLGVVPSSEARWIVVFTPSGFSTIPARNGIETSLRYSSSAATNAMRGSIGCQPLVKWGWSVFASPVANSRARSPFTGRPFGPRQSPKPR